MLSKVAERMYWFARYLERVENTARMVGVYDNLLFDLPRSINIGWYNLVVINSCSGLFAERYRVRDERNVVKFLLADDTNPSSMLNSLAQARENIRTTRDVLPRETWELINELYLYVKENIQDGINRTHRHAFLDAVIKGSQQINGLLEANMSRDAVWQFIRLGRNLERADMTTRILDAGCAAQLSSEAVEHNLNPSQIIWGNVLRSSSADLNYRRTVRAAVSAPDVAHFLLADTHFPRSLAFCLSEMEAACQALPACALPGLRDLKAVISLPVADEEPGEQFREYLNDLQLELAGLHHQFTQCWFAAA